MDKDFEKKLNLCLAKLNKEIDLDWIEIVEELGLDCSADHLRKTAYGMKETFEYFNNKTTWSILGGSKPTAQYQRAIDVAKQYYPDITKLSDEQILSIGRDLNPGEKVSSGMKTIVVTVKDAATGRNVTKTVK